MKVLITGISGFIAPHLAEAALNRGWEVLGVDILDCDIYKDGKDGFVFKKKDVRDLTLQELDGVDYIFHMAFVTSIPDSIEHPIETSKDSLDMTIYLLELAKKAGIKKFVFPSTASLYGNNPLPWKEDMPLQPVEPYSWQKLACEYALKTWTNCYGLPTVIFRMFQVFGERQRKNTALAAFFRAKKEGKPITLTETSPSSSFRTSQRDFIYVKDIADAFIKAAESDKTGKGEVINIASGKVTTMEEVAKAIGGEIVFVPKRGFEVERHEADITKARELLDWRPKTDVLEWLKEFIKTL
ncbi:MAG: NAD-dependent epimerase/dehydratase family protein [Candidatus Azambacteria bacterium]|nr:NAD-dependent epimerase/dehydratase family protein [Candidatus Azambacteria bacterium]